MLQCSIVVLYQHTCMIRIVLSHCVSFVNNTIFIRHVFIVNHSVAVRVSLLLQRHCQRVPSSALERCCYDNTCSNCSFCHSLEVSLPVRGIILFTEYLSQVMDTPVIPRERYTLPYWGMRAFYVSHKRLNDGEVFSTDLYMPVICYSFAL